MLEALKAARIAKEAIRIANVSVEPLLKIMGVQGPEIPLDNFARLFDRLMLPGVNKLHLTELYANMRTKNNLHVKVDDFCKQLGIM